jgi:hypothetical protein
MPRRGKMSDISYVCDQIDRLMTVEFRVYGMHTDDSKPQTRGTIAKLYDAARERQGDSLIHAAVMGLLDNIKPYDVVLITTGWVVPFWIPRGETDGTIGALAIAKALSGGLDARIVFLTEESCKPVLQAGCLAAGLREYELEFLLDTPMVGRGGGVSFINFTTDASIASSEANTVLDKLKPSAVISIEKAGRNSEGVYHTGFGNDFSATCVKADYLVEEARKRNIFTIGIIDLGNEIGSGKIVDTVRAIMPWGSKCKCRCGAGIASIVETDSLIVSTTCNFGAYALTAALGAALDDLDLIHSVESERLYAMECGRAGAIDGATVNSGGFRYLNGVKLEDYAPFIQLLKTIAKAKDIKFRHELRHDTG